MKGLLIKDVLFMRNQRSSAFLILIMGVAMSLYMQASAVIGYLMMMGGMLALSTMSYDEYENGYRYLFSLPTTREEYVKEKYLFCLIFVFLSMTLGALASFVIMVIKKQIDMEELIGTSVTMFSVLIIFLAVSIFSRIKYGSEKSKIIIYVFFGAIGLIGYLLSNFVSKETVAAVESFVKTNDTILMIGLPVLALMVFFISYLLSARVMEKKEF